MKKLLKELKDAEEKMIEAKNEYMNKPTYDRQDWYNYCKRYYDGLKKAFDLLKGENR